MATIPAPPDGRREAGERTCQRLLEATLSLLAQRGEDGVTLREITDAADANVAAVSYHFGSKPALIKRAIDHAIDRVLDTQAAALQALGERPSLEGIAGAMARPVIDALAGGGEDLALFRIIVRATIDPPHGCRERLAGQLDRRRSQLLDAVRVAQPTAGEDELMFRVDALIGLLDWLVLTALAPGAPSRLDAPRTAPELERLLVPMLEGALTGSAVGQTRGC
jgi:AcrR family transcriptional regulator